MREGWVRLIEGHSNVAIMDKVESMSALEFTIGGVFTHLVIATMVMCRVRGRGTSPTEKNMVLRVFGGRIQVPRWRVGGVTPVQRER